MKNNIRILLALIFLCSCQVEEKITPSNDIIVSGHKTYPNAFVIVDPLAGAYLTGDTLSFTMRFPVPVNVDLTTGSPQLMLDIGGNLIGAEYVSGDGTTDLHFEYTVNSIDTDTNGIDIFSLAVNGAVLTFTNGSIIKMCQSQITSKHFHNITINL